MQRKLHSREAATRCNIFEHRTFSIRYFYISPHFQKMQLARLWNSVLRNCKYRNDMFSRTVNWSLLCSIILFCYAIYHSPLDREFTSLQRLSDLLAETMVEEITALWDWMICRFQKVISSPTTPSDNFLTTWCWLSVQCHVDSVWLWYDFVLFQL